MNQEVKKISEFSCGTTALMARVDIFPSCNWKSKSSSCITEEFPGKCHVPKTGNKLSNNCAIQFIYGFEH